MEAFTEGGGGKGRKEGLRLRPVLSGLGNKPLPRILGEVHTSTAKGFEIVPILLRLQDDTLAM